MLKVKHLQPWLLVYFVVALLLFLATVGVIVTIIINDISGFNFSYVQFLTCLYSTNIKLNTYMAIILKTCFILTIVSCVLAVGQTIFLTINYLNFRKLITLGSN